MTFKIQVTYDQGEEDGKILAIVQEKDLETAIAVARQAVRKMRGPGAIVEATSASEFNQHVVLIADGEKPKWLTRADAEDLHGQTHLKGTKPGESTKEGRA